VTTLGASSFALGLKPPYYAVVFSSQRTEGDHGYGATGDRMVELAAQQPGYLGVESVRGADGFGITVSYWDSEQAIANWKRDAEHRIAQERGRSQWYAHYELRVARVERAYAMASAASGVS
jgi:heme-degrading monooxygenase HmoA